MAQEELCLDGEEWRDVVGYEGYYQVSNLGRVRSLDRITRGPANATRMVKGRVLKNQKCSNGYLFVVLSVLGKHKCILLHRIVSKAFIPNPDNLPCVDHINCNKEDNRVCNLRWVTPLENVHHSIEAGNVDFSKRAETLNHPAVREKNLIAVRRPVIRSDGKKYASITEAANHMGCNRRAITLVLSGTNKTCKGYTFTYA